MRISEGLPFGRVIRSDSQFRISCQSFFGKICVLVHFMMGISPFILSFFMLLVTVNAGDMMRKSIVFDKKTPGVFYCPQHKPTGFEKLFVHAKPISKLCEFEGRPLPADYKSDCYHDLDETEYACKEKYRIMKRYAKKIDKLTEKEEKSKS